MDRIESYGLSPFDVANWFTCSLDREAGDSITHIETTKITVLCTSLVISFKWNSTVLR